MVTFLVVFLLSYIAHGLGVTVGYHRLLSHRSFRSGKALEYLLVGAGYLAFQGSPLWWSTLHRVHHKNTDTEFDLHSPRKGWMHAYFSWTLQDLNLDSEKHCKDITNDPVYLFLDKCDAWVIPINLALRGIVWALFGWQIALANLLAAVCVVQIPMLLNLFCHIPSLGYKNFDSVDDASNVWWVGILALGEGWHNNHHVFPGSARMGMRPFEFDLSWLFIRLCQRLGLISQVNDASRTNTFQSGNELIPVSTGKD